MGDSFNRASGEGMRTRPDYGEAAPGSAQAMYRLEEFSKESGLERPLLELVKTRVSQINGCAVCTDVMLRSATPSTTIRRNMPAPTGPVSRIPGGDTTTGQKTSPIMTRTVTFGQGGRMG